ncbi:MAG: hypothetical protein M1828_007637 [Chrysothrix sp. TS-e1954]|nr:MAG: hypothetical protein M1828_007637 [Chrysothrix sp. TS-e1954]
MANKNVPAEGESLTYTDGRDGAPDLRFIHYNDVYHIEAGSRDPVGGIARFQSVCKHYYKDEAFKGYPKAITLFSGDAFNPSLESSVTKGSHMVAVLNVLADGSCWFQNHDLDFGVPQFQHLASQCHFPWLLANVHDPALSESVPLGRAKPTCMLTASNGLKVGIIGLVEREWLDTINSLPPNLIYKSASATAKELVPHLRAHGADIIIAITHQREPNDNKLAEKTPPGLIDLIVGGHDHFYQHSVINGTHVLRSGTDFKNLSYLSAWRKPAPATGWDFTITRRDIVRSIPPHPAAARLADKISSGLKSRLNKAVGYTTAPLDARFTTVRLKESNLGNFVCDLMRLYYHADCTVMAGGTLRGDQVYPPGPLTAGDLLNCFPFEDPVVVLRVKGKAIWEALENGVSLYPALEGRFPQVSNIKFAFDPSAAQGSRIQSVKVGHEPLDMSRSYTLATRDYMARGKDGYTSLLSQEGGGEAEEVISEENGILISMLLRQYFMSMRILGKWQRWSAGMHKHWDGIHGKLHLKHPVKHPQPATPGAEKSHDARHAINENGGALDSEDEHAEDEQATERELIIMRRVFRKWWRLTGLQGAPGVGGEEEEFSASWTKAINPKIEGRIVIVGETA